MDTEKIILNPARLRILQYIRLHGSARTSDIVGCLNDIPRATIYHHVRILEENGLLEVVKENRIRGTTEKIYAFRKAGIPTEGDASVALSTSFHIGLMQEMNDYLGGEKHDCTEDNVCFSTALVQVTDSEYRQLLADMIGLMKPYLDRPCEPGLKLRKLSIISSPPAKEEGMQDSFPNPE